MKHKLLSLSIALALTACGDSNNDENTNAQVLPKFAVQVKADPTCEPQVIAATQEGAEPETIACEMLWQDLDLAEDAQFATVIATKIDNPSGQILITDANKGESLFYPLETLGTYGNFVFNSVGEWNYTLWQGSSTSETPEHPEVKALVKSGLADLTESFTITTADGTEKVFTVAIRGIDENATFAGTLERSVARDTGKGESTGTTTVSDANPAEAFFKTVLEQPNAVATDIDGIAKIITTYGEVTIKLLEPIKAVAAVAADPDNGIEAVKAIKSSPSRVEWVYDLDEMNADVIALADASESLTDTFTLTALDGTEQVVTLIVVGSDQVPATFVSKGGVTANEDGSFSATISANEGSLAAEITVVDLNFEEEYFKPLDNAATALGSVSIDAAGVLSYKIDYTKDAVKALLLAQSADPLPTIEDTLTLETIDGTISTVIVSVEAALLVPAIIEGLPSVDGDLSSAAVSSKVNTTSGTLTISDDNAFQAAFMPADLMATYGSFTIDAAGSWSYTLSADSLTALDNGSLPLPFTEQIIVSSEDGTEVTLPITITAPQDLNFGAKLGSSDGKDAKWVISMPESTELTGKATFTLRVPETSAKDIKVQFHGATRQTAVNKQLFSMVLKPSNGSVLIYDGTGTSTSNNTFAHSETFTKGDLITFELTWDSLPDTLAANGDKSSLSLKINGSPLSGHASIVDGVFPSFSAAASSEFLTGPTLLEVQTKTTDTLDIDDFKVYSDLAGTTEIFSEAFDAEEITQEGSMITVDYSAGGTTSNSIASAIEFPALEAISTQYAELTHDTGYGLLRIDLPAQIKAGKVTARVKVTDPIQSAYLSLFGNSNEQSRAMVDLNLQTSGATSLRGVAEADRLVEFDKNNRVYTNLNLDQTHNLGEWNTIEVTWDATTAVNDTADGGIGGLMPTVTMTINGEEVSDDAVGKITNGAFASPSFVSSTVVGGVKMLALKCGTSAKVDAGTCAIDDIKIYSDITGTNLILSQDFEKSSLGTIDKAVIPAQDETGHDSAKYGDSRIATVVEVQ